MYKLESVLDITIDKWLIFAPIINSIHNNKTYTIKLFTTITKIKEQPAITKYSNNLQTSFYFQL